MDEDDWSFDICRQNVYIKCFAISLPVSVCFLSSVSPDICSPGPLVLFPMSSPVYGDIPEIVRIAGAMAASRVGYCDNQMKDGGIRSGGGLMLKLRHWR